MVAVKLLLPFGSLGPGIITSFGRLISSSSPLDLHISSPLDLHISSPLGTLLSLSLAALLVSGKVVTALEAMPAPLALKGRFLTVRVLGPDVSHQVVL